MEAVAEDMVGMVDMVDGTEVIRNMAVVEEDMVLMEVMMLVVGEDMEKMEWAVVHGVEVEHTVLGEIWVKMEYLVVVEDANHWILEIRIVGVAMEFALSPIME